MALSAAQRVSESKSDSSGAIASFIDTTFQHQSLPPLSNPNDSLDKDQEKFNSTSNKPNHKRANNHPDSSDQYDQAAIKNIGNLLRHVPRVYKVSGNKPAENDQEKLVETVRTLRRVYGICEALDKNFGGQTSQNDNRGSRK